jgi:hypothetical protein
MILPTLVLLLGISGVPPASPSAAPIERIVVVLGERDAVSSSRVLHQLKACTDGTPTAVVSTFGTLRVERDFATDGGFVLTGHLAPEKSGKAQSVAVYLQLLAEALAPVGSTTALVLISPRVGAESGMAVTSPWQPAVEGAQSPSVESYDTTAIPAPVLEARKALRKAGLTVVAVNIGRVYDAGAKALTEIPRGHYLQTSQGNFGKALVSAVCGAGR